MENGDTVPTKGYPFVVRHGILNQKVRHGSGWSGAARAELHYAPCGRRLPACLPPVGAGRQTPIFQLV